MIVKAIEKIETEMKQHEKDRSIQSIGNFLLQQLAKKPENAEKIINIDKTIVKSMEYMRKEVEKTIVKTKKTGGVTCMITDAEGFEIVLKYYGIEEKENDNCNAFDMLKGLLD
ncbi:Cas9 inhibitor AcrIIA9 family protein [Clostridium estertheticum]|uniref:Cas9 inhibitor AcrIIA9 family protein n=1 Tax=Clostridium estertheticum TaxID=238834 RepID=UPI001C7D95C6|nr:Cas9 inhibitor AcrIIA9 family protein [Clostridium estertheticum]MBX4267154.1 hypothetical protein [Clostridium estertheticum]MBX4272019.1 hypothetical protein [Clostridium estertheticum]WLC82404.1 hypothetical protein KTC98_24065 [Clostridium estertheticum]WLC91277.1 hypothetical protein KTC95_24035 [Clostridium estertheticum]